MPNEPDMEEVLQEHGKYLGVNGTNNLKAPILSTSVATSSIANSVNPDIGETVAKNLHNNGMSSIAKDNPYSMSPETVNVLQKGLDIYALGSGISNYVSGQGEYSDTLGSMDEAVQKLSNTKTNISDALSSNLSELNTNFSETTQNNAIGVLSKNKSKLIDIQDSNTDFGSGRLTHLKNQGIASINKILKTTFNNQKMKMDETIDQSVQTAQGVTSKLSTDIKNIENEMKEVRKAKDAQGLNLVKDLVGYASYYVDPTGTTKSMIGATKYKNKYT